MPHSVRDDKASGDHSQSRHQVTPPPSSQSGSSSQEESPMLKAWEAEHNPSNLTITETLFQSGLTSARTGA
ncbi:uncharacterized protein PODANS_6_1420 [Podospora anserina S mat+]|uniref:Podospora anserina S mat+ genomic DNA chromosome 6, supercontig 2 n=2 Tax=Podospora TaxID=5144 RepID=B2B312_PODAN|nr:uncharacterized protein PODANS_6_1420 [Podospora anserina S mat+]KAK4651673.1 hypothetical protein QC762_601420 [Podospora pseudocomata]CAP71498.1 unnamed protein product [Podospora anserina S mat+]CDP30894.1 Putative protein of unknown function [Podospora anserina S mat+]